jgi:hypothetical protein
MSLKTSMISMRILQKRHQRERLRMVGGCLQAAMKAHAPKARCGIRAMTSYIDARVDIHVHGRLLWNTRARSVLDLCAWLQIKKKRNR